METEFQKAIGKSMSEVLCDLAELFVTPYPLHSKPVIDLCTLIPELNMRTQLSFALLSEAHAQGWDEQSAAAFFRRAAAGAMREEETEALLHAFSDQGSASYLALEKKYGNRFLPTDGAYWPTLFALGVDSGEVEHVLNYLRLFTVTLMEFAYMEDHNPEKTYTWGYYESFRAMLDSFTAPESAPLPVKVCAMGGSVGKRQGESYLLSLGIDLKNPNPDRMARNVALEITLSDQHGNKISVIRDRIASIDPDAVYHFGITKRIRGAAVAHFNATAKVGDYLKLSTPLMNHLALQQVRLTRKEDTTQLKASLENRYGCPLSSVTLHYQYLSEDNKILGGGAECILDSILPDDIHPILSTIPVSIPNAKKLVYSTDFDALELIQEK